MKKFRKIMAVLVAAIMIVAMAVPAWADVTISVAQDSSYAGETDGNSRTFTYYHIFRATKNGTSTTEGGGYDTNGLPGDVTQASSNTATGFAYYLNSTDDATQIGALGTWVAAVADDDPATTDIDESKDHWVKASGNLWFKLTKSADGARYEVEWDNISSTSTTVQDAATWLKTNYTPLSSGSLTWDSTDKKWKATVSEGYYLLVSDTGKNLIAATTDIAVNEKNSYPPLDKQQKDHDDDSAFSDNAVEVAVGDVIDYKVTVTIPKTAKANDLIQVYDVPSTGLSYNSDMVVTIGNDTVTPGTSGVVQPETLESGDAWRYTVTVTNDYIGKEVVFSYSMTVSSGAVTDINKKNTSGLKYGTSSGYTYSSVPDEVTYKTYFTGIEKQDGTTNTTKLANVEFTLKEGGSNFPVAKHADGYYYYDSTGNATVKTDASGLIKIRGLDSDKTYQLIETKTNPGYKMLSEPVTLTLTEDTGTVYADATAATWTDVDNYLGTALPNTGGMGTTVLYIVGGMLVILAGAYLFFSRKKTA